MQFFEKQFPVIAKVAFKGKKCILKFPYYYT